MSLDNIRRDDDAVSPVVGIVMMVAVTVILAAIIATYAFGMTVDDPAPTASFSYDYDDVSDVLTVTHASGDPIRAGYLSVQGDLGSSCPAVDLCDARRTLGDTSAFGGDSTFRSGNSFTLSTTGDDFQIEVVYDDGEQSASLDGYEGPDA